MKHLGIGVLCLLVGGCGNLSNDDLIFLAALPDRANLALHVPGTELEQRGQGLSELSQGLDGCAEDDLLCQAWQVSSGINAGVFALLDLVDAIVTRFPPTRREPDRRVWGPSYVATSRSTVRFEMIRNSDSLDGIFSYCLHATLGRIPPGTGDQVRCDEVEHSSGLTRIFHGAFAPGPERGGARWGQGSLVFDHNLARRVGLARPGDQGIITVEYDNTEEQVAIGVKIREVVDQRTLLPSSADYRYQRAADGSGQFRFVILADFVPFLFTSLEQLEIGARWNPAGAGRADAVVTGGDLVNQEVTASQCWDTDLETVYYQDSADEHGSIGAVEACVYDTALAG